MNIDGNEVRIGAIDAVTAIEVVFTDAGDVGTSTDKIARGSFDVVVRGGRITIRRTKRCVRERSEIEKAESFVRDTLELIRASVVAVLATPLQ